MPAFAIPFAEYKTAVTKVIMLRSCFFFQFHGWIKVKLLNNVLMAHSSIWQFISSSDRKTNNHQTWQCRHGADLDGEHPMLAQSTAMIPLLLTEVYKHDCIAVIPYHFSTFLSNCAIAQHAKLRCCTKAEIRVHIYLSSAWLPAGNRRNCYAITTTHVQYFNKHVHF